MISKTAMITICGRPNVGKSTLTNALVGEKIAIVSNKPQTTRTRICAIVARGDTQLVFIDTPGFHRPRTKLGDYMVNIVNQSVADVDAVILLVEPIANVGPQEQELIEKKKAAGGLLLSAALACMATGITEPLEFSFLFVAPALFAVQVVLAGTAYMIAHMLNIAVGLTFSGGLLDFFLFGILQGNAKTSWLRIIPVGIIYFFLYYFIFSFLIKKFNFKTPGREDDDTETKLYTKADVNARKEAGKETAGNTGTADSVSEAITQGLGGKKNISDVDCCATRLRITVHDAARVNDEIIKTTGSRGIVKKGQGVQIIYGPQVTVIKSKLEDYLETAPDEYYESAAVSEENSVEENTDTVNEN